MHLNEEVAKVRLLKCYAFSHRVFEVSRPRFFGPVGIFSSCVLCDSRFHRSHSLRLLSVVNQLDDRGFCASGGDYSGTGVLSATHSSSVFCLVRGDFSLCFFLTFSSAFPPLRQVSVPWLAFAYAFD